jgi:hypothetical protein
MTKDIALKAMNQGMALVTGRLALPPLVIEGLEDFKGSVDRLCLRAGTVAIEAMLAADAEQLCGKRYQHHADRQGHRWGMIDSEVGWHGGKAAIRRPRVRCRGGAELELPSCAAIHRVATSSNGSPRRCTPGSRRCCVRLGTARVPSRPSAFCGTWRGGSIMMPPASRLRSSKGWTRCSSIHLGLPPELRRSLGCTNAIESLIAVLRQVCRNLTRWRDARMALRWTGTAMLEAEKSFRRLKANKRFRLSGPLCCGISKRCAISPLPEKNLAA